MRFDGMARISHDRPDVVWGMAALAFLEDVSLVVLDDEFVAQKGLADLPSTFVDFADLARVDLPAFRERMRTGLEPRFLSQWLNAPPLMRLLRSHCLWSWFEASVVARLAAEGEGRREVRLGRGRDGLTFIYEVLARAGGRVLVAGPNQLAGSDDDVREALSEFNVVSDLATSDGERAQGVGAPHYALEHLARHAQSRRGGRGAEGVGIDRRPFCRGLRVFASGTADDATLPSLARTAALLSTEAALVTFGGDSVRVSELRDAYAGVFGHGAGHRPAGGAVDPALDRFIRHREQTGLLAWNRYFHESSTLFSDWLATNSYLSIAPRVFTSHGELTRTWNRACRFLGRLFYCAEVTIYRYCVGEPERPLRAVAGHYEQTRSDDEQVRRGEEMAAVAPDAELRARSVSYRAADLNASQYVARAEPDAPAFLSSPMRGGLAARSVLAVPIRLNGGVWGVAEFVAVRDHHFEPLLRAKCEELTAAMASHFLLANIFEVLGRLEGYWSDTFTEDRGRRGELCFALSHIFVGDALSVYVGSRDEDGTIFSVERFGRWSSPAATAAMSRGVELATVRAFLEGGDMLHEVLPERDAREDGMRRTFIVRLLPDASMRWAGALVFSVPYPVRADAAWKQTTFALGQIVAGVVSNVSSDASWNKEARRDLRHEYLWMLDSLRGATSRLARIGARASPLIGEGDRRGLEAVPGDLTQVANALESMSEALLADVYDRHTIGDRRLVSVRKAQERYWSGPQESVNLRDTFYSRFRTAIGAFPRQRLQLQVNPLVAERSIRMAPETLSAIMATLADNAVKYSVPGSEIIMSFGERRQGGTFLVRISNLGAALEPDEARHIFEDGFRGRAARRDQPKRGSGLGLKYAKGAMELWDGALEYDVSAPSSDIRALDGRPAVWHRFTLVFPKHLQGDRERGKSVG